MFEYEKDAMKMYVHVCVCWSSPSPTLPSTDLELEFQERTLADTDAEGRIPLRRPLAGPLRQRLEQLPVPLEGGLCDESHLLDRQRSHGARGLPKAVGELGQGVEVAEGGLELGAVEPVALPHAPVDSAVYL